MNQELMLVDEQFMTCIDATFPEQQEFLQLTVAVFRAAPHNVVSVVTDFIDFEDALPIRVNRGNTPNRRRSRK